MNLTQAAEALVAAGREFDRLGMASAGSGNMSMVVGDEIIVTPTGSSLGRLSARGLSVVSRTGEHLSGPSPTKELPLHLAILERVPGSTAAVHLHSTYAVAQACREPWSAHSAIPPLTPYFVMRVGRVPLLPYVRPGSPRLAEIIAEVDGAFSAALMKNHGSILAGSDLESVADAAIELESTARLQILLGSTATPLDGPAIAELVNVFGATW